MLEELHFLRPLWLLALLPLLAMGLRWLRHPPRYNPWREQVDEHLLCHLVLERQHLSRLPAVLLLTAWLLAVLALAGPTWTRHAAIQFRPAVPPLVIVLDLSRSMDAVDLRPSRLALVQARLRQLLERLSPRPVGLVVFAAQAHSVMPLTEDAALITGLLDDLHTGLMPLQGSNPLAGLSLGQELLRRGGMKQGDLLLVTDGAGPEAAALARRLMDEGTTLTVYAPATTGGGPIPDGAGFLSAAEGLVQSALDERALQTLAEAGGGRYIPYAREGGDLGRLLAALERPLSVADGLPQGQGESWREEGPWLLLILLPLGLLAFRPGWEMRGVQLPLAGARTGLVSLLLVLALQLPTAEALEWADLWWRADQQEAQTLREGRADQARVLRHDLMWRGIFHYRQGEYELAVSAFSPLDNPMGHYNRGNALVQLGRLEGALGAYERALQLDPGHRHARLNRDLVREELRQLAPDEPELEVDLSRPEDEVGSKGGEEERVEPYLEDYLEPDEGKLKTEVPDVPGPDESPGTLGGGAVLLQGEEDKEGEEGPSMGQSADEGEAGEREEESEITRAGRIPGRAQPRIKDEEQQQAPSQGPSEQGLDAEKQRGGGGLPPETPSSVSPEEREGQSGRELSADDRPPENLVAPMGEPSRLDSPQAREGSDEELQQALEQWLKRIPDEPVGLLREKFLREYRRSHSKPVGLDPW